MAEIVVSNRVMLQDESGRFMANIDGKAHEAVWEVTRIMAAFAVSNAPFKTGQLRQSIEGFMTGAAEGTVVATAPHALPQETGAGPHLIGEGGQLLHNPEEGFGPTRGPVLHPGNPATRFMRKAFHEARAIAPAIFARHFGG